MFSNRRSFTPGRVGSFDVLDIPPRTIDFYRHELEEKVSVDRQTRLNGAATFMLLFASSELQCEKSLNLSFTSIVFKVD